ncbi:hypothetical protein [Limosilactobacillus oris]|uniref:hypothetical protein n=1 Tax=Limosilactobacillus oris TaxID=1632 RepID=UPI00265B6D98|nr:hypothetical protein [Limosilactobacillus oris]
MKISDFVEKVKKYGCGTKVSGTTIALYKMTEYYVEVDAFSPREKKTRLENNPFLVMDMIDPQFVTMEHWQSLSDLGAGNLLSILDLVERVKNTPVPERFNGRVWRLRWIHPDGIQKDRSGYLKTDGTFWETSRNSDDATLFTSTELEELKQKHPKYAPAIDAIKEPLMTDGSEANND